jgi:hypothetical protein
MMNISAERPNVLSSNHALPREKGSQQVRNITPPASRNQHLLLTDHARKKLDERAISADAIKIALTYADVCHDAGSRGCVRAIMSRRACAEALSDGVPAKTVDRAQGLHLVLSGVGSIITVYKRTSTRRRTSCQSRKRRGGWRKL